MEFTLPNPAVFIRDCVVGLAAFTYASLVNSGDANLTITALALTTGAKFDSLKFVRRSDGGSLTLPISLPPNVDLTFLVIFKPVAGDEDILLTDDIKVTHNGDNGPTTSFEVLGRGRRKGQPLVSISPWAWNFSWVGRRNQLAGIDIGDLSNAYGFLITNTGDELLSIENIRVNFPFIIVDPVPSLPVWLSPFSSLTIYLRAFAELDGQVIYNGIDGAIAVEILTNVGISPIQNIVGAVTGLPVVSAFVISGVTKKALAAFGSIVRQFDLTSLEPERPAKLIKVIDLQKPHQEKLLAKFRARYEDLGPAKFDLTVKTRDETSSVVTTSIGTATADGLTREALIDEQLNEQIFKLTIDHVSGPLSFVDFGIDHEPRGPVLD